MEHVRRQIKQYFNDLTLDHTTHIYTVGKNPKPLPSVSGLIKRFHKPFPKDAAAKFAEKNGLHEKDVRAMWKAKSDEACDRGHRVHDFGENYMFDRSLKPRCKQEEAVVKFWNELPERYIPLIAELEMYHKIYRYAGTADILLYDKLTDTIVIADYKTNEDIFKNFKGECLLPPFQELLNNPLNKYQLQFSFYQILFEQTGLKVSARKLIWLLHDGTYKMYGTNDYTDRLDLELKKMVA